MRVTPDFRAPEVVEEVPQLASLAECEDSPYGGWAFDDPARPSMLQLCPCTCEFAGYAFTEVRYGCQVPEP